MLRCNTCGYINDEQVDSCTKCGAALNDAKKTVENPNNQGGFPTTSGDPLAHQKRSQKTVKGAVPNQPYLDNPRNQSNTQAENDEQTNSCGSCRYPLRTHQNICPNCGFDNATDMHSTKDFEENAQDDAPVEPRQKTILDPWEVTNIGESKKFVLVTDKGKTTLDFEGEEVSLNRQNLDVSNKSISGGQHAKIEYENGQWYIKDESSNGFTFVQVRDRMPIQSGDMIIMGNKLFVFKEE